jgi:hypothetical protein
MKVLHVLSVAILLFAISCTNPADKKKIKELATENAILDSLKTELLAENKMLKENLSKYENEKAEEIQAEKERLEKLKKASQGLILNDKIQVVTVKTGFDPYHNTDNLWLPAITLMFKNISKGDINDFIKVRAVFIDNSSGEQLAEDYEYLCTSSRPLISGTKKQITLQSSVGWYAVQNQNVSVKISIEDDPFKTYKIKNTEFRGRI